MVPETHGRAPVFMSRDARGATLLVALKKAVQVPLLPVARNFPTAVRLFL